MLEGVGSPGGDDVTVRVVHRPARLNVPRTEPRVQALATPPTMDDGTTPATLATQRGFPELGEKLAAQSSG